MKVFMFAFHIFLLTVSLSHPWVESRLPPPFPTKTRISVPNVTRSRVSSSYTDTSIESFVTEVSKSQILRSLSIEVLNFSLSNVDTFPSKSRELAGGMKHARKSFKGYFAADVQTGLFVVL